MHYTEFKNKLKNLPLIESRDIILLHKDTQVLRNQLNRWQVKKLIIKLKRGFYILNENDRKATPSRFYIANRLCEPSYVSMESALSFYGLIPEQVRSLTSVTSKKTLRIKNDFGEFLYQHIKPEAFRGFRVAKDSEGFDFFIAVPEKAVTDFLYLNLRKMVKAGKDVFSASYRFQNTEGLSSGKIMELAKLYDNKQLMRIVQDFCAFIKEGKRK